jgi:hypothetical protein
MNRQEYLFEVAGEECAEIAQMTSKINRFGIHEIFPEQPLTNAQRMHLEIDDLQAMIEMLNDEFNFNYVPDRERIEAKKKKVNKYYEYSKSLGLAERE